MPDRSIGTARGGQIPVSPNNPCPFLRALVANGYVGGHVVPLSKLSEIVGDASGQTGLGEKKVRLATWLVAVIANGLGPLRVLKSAFSGAVLDQLRDGPLRRIQILLQAPGRDRLTDHVGRTAERRGGFVEIVLQQPGLGEHRANGELVIARQRRGAECRREDLSGRCSMSALERRSCPCEKCLDGRRWHDASIT